LCVGEKSDPLTIAWLGQNIDKVFGFPGVVRFSWSTVTLLLKDKAIDVNWYEDEEETDPSQLSLSVFFKPASAKSKDKRAMFYETCGLDLVREFSF